MFEISVRTHFSAAHRLLGHGGACAARHGHNWEVEVFLRGKHLDRLGMLVDFAEVKAAVRETLEALDHKDLNEQACFAKVNPTSENIARYLFEALGRRLNKGGIRVARVMVSETPGAGAAFWRE